ncbi:MAG: tail fiber domain-containing protein [Agathobacter rectalis]
MLNVSAKWQRAVMLDNDINVNCFADIVTASGEKIPISDSELWANGFEVNDSTSSNGTFTIGALIAGKLKIKLNNIYEDYSKYDFDKASVTAYVSKSFSDGTSEKLKIGEYRVSETSYDGSLITLTCLDNINNFNREYDSNLSYPTTAYEVVRDACIKCDVPFTMARFDNSDYVINEIPSDNQKLTYGQVIAYILQLSGLWGKCGHDGELLIEWYDMSQFGSQNYNGGTFSTKTTPYSDGDSVDGGNFTDYSSGDSVDGGTFTETRNYHNIYTQKDLNVATDDVVITGVKVTVTSKEDKTKDVSALAGKEGYVVSISDNPFISADKAQTVANYIFKKIGGMRFRPLDATLLSNPLIESGDVALVTDRKQNTYSCFISNRTFTVGSGTKISCDAENASRNSADKFSNETKAVVQARKVAQAQLSVYDKQMQLLTQLMSQSLGLFKTEQVQEDGSIIYIMHNKADLKSSNIQWKMTANGMAVSSDYGKTWNAGVDKDGNAIVNIMSAIGINFDWAHGGTLTLGGEDNTNGKQYVKDANGKILITLDNKGITLADGVNISWNNISNKPSIPTDTNDLTNGAGYIDSDKATQITKDTVTTSYVNALSVKAGSVDAEDIIGTTITGKNIVGGTIDIGNGVFAVDNDGKVTASNFNMSGGSIALNGNLSNSTIDLTATDNSGNNYELWMNGAVLRIVKNDENLITLYGVTGTIGAQTMYAQEIGSDKFRETDRGYAMCGDATGHTYHCGWNGSALSFQVDTTWVWSSSDKRLKKNIGAINQDYIDAVGSVDLFQYNLNRQGYSDKPLYFGAMAQDIIESLKDKGHVDENLDMIFQNKATSDDDTLYYGMNYEQFLILRLAGDEQKIDKMQKHIDELEDKFSRLCRKLGIDESEV